MKSKCVPGVLLLAALPVAFGFVHVTAATEVLLLPADGTATVTLTDPYENRTSDTYLTDTSPLEYILTEETTSLSTSNTVTNQEESSATKFHSVVTENKDIISTASPDNSWITASLTTAKETTYSTGTESIPGTYLISQANYSPSSSSTETLPVTLNDTTAAMETETAVCIRPTGLTDAEVLAIVVGAVFITILISALLYQLSVFMKNKNHKRDSCIYIIENELPKYDVEANGLQAETKL